MPTLHALLPEAVYDPTRPSGGNTYDRRLVAELGPLGWTVQEHLVAGRWPVPDATGRCSLIEAAQRVGTGELVLVDGLIASGCPEAVVPLARRAALVVLVHLPLGGPVERTVLHVASAVIATSAWSRTRLLELHELDPARVHVAEPGVDAAPLAIGTRTGGSLLCVGALTPVKGHDRLIDAFGSLTDLSWNCVLAGSLDVDAPFAAAVAARARRAGIAHRVTFAGPLGTDDLASAYASADLLVQPSRVETYGMVVTEALARGVPVVASDAGGLPRTLRGPNGPDGQRAAGETAGLAGVLVPGGDVALLAITLRSWLTDAGLRESLRKNAIARRTLLSPWSESAGHVAALLTTVTG